MGHLPHQEVGPGPERLEDHDGEREHEPPAQQGDHRDGHREDQVEGENVVLMRGKNILMSCSLYFYRRY